MWIWKNEVISCFISQLSCYQELQSHQKHINIVRLSSSDMQITAYKQPEDHSEIKINIFQFLYFRGSSPYFSIDILCKNLHPSISRSIFASCIWDTPPKPKDAVVTRAKTRKSCLLIVSFFTKEGQLYTKHLNGNPNEIVRCFSSWWFQPIWKILVKLDHFPK